MEKQIEHILEGREKSIGEETVLQSLPHKEFRFASPFIVVHHLPAATYPAGSPPERLHPHPHRGFAPVTFLFQGEGYHRDSQGNSGILKAGEVQWMFSGSGLLHSEGPSEEFLEKGGVYELVQLWVNVPAKHKMETPFYQQAAAEQMPAISKDPGIDLHLVSGNYQQLTGPINKSFTPVTAIFGSMQAGKTISFFPKEGDWTLLYVLDGAILINDRQPVNKRHLVVFSKTGTGLTVTAKENVRLLYLSATPIDEPVAARGNFVMNTSEELDQAEADFSAGKFGVLDY
jgi:quercetin 2,3-dioxygenase